MLYRFKYYFVIFFVLTLESTYGQHRIENEIILQLNTNANIDNVINSLRRQTILKGIKAKKPLSQLPYNFWKITLDRAIIPQNINKIQEFKDVVKVQYNHKISYRNIPDDSLFYKQWSLNNTGQTGGQNNADIDADLAWELTTGGLSPTGDTIVICIIDNGIDTSHIDLIDNLWKNYNEIRGNGIDDDQNGYIDDFLGWNTANDTDNIYGGSHGTPVSGIIGAKGNNKIGISGINWNVKIMMLVNDSDEAGIISAYLYALKMRKLYNETNGEKGAFIVATNTSLGIDNEKAGDHPIWCSIYDSLGTAGIINIGATTNFQTDVDVEGDMPSSCPGDYLLTVTNINQNNQKVNSAGYGERSIDIGAYGENTYSTYNNSTYGTFGGTSAATPHATGVAGLLFAYSKKINEISHSANPSNAALMVKDAIMNGVIHNSSLEKITISEGVLNAYNALKKSEKYDSDCPPPVNIKIDSIGGDLVMISWEDYDPDKKYNLKYKLEAGESQTIKNIVSPYILNGLLYCSEYQLILQTVCDTNTVISGFPIHIKTIGCCDPPVLTKSVIKDGKLHLEWENKLAADKYLIESRYWSFPLWDTITTTDNVLNLDYDFSCGEYIFNIQSICNETISNKQNNILIGDTCNECNNIVYCTPQIYNDLEWIQKFSISGFEFESGKNTAGYGKFNNTPALTLVENKMYALRVDLGFKNEIYDDNVYIWIDFNRDGVFTGDEIIFHDKNDSNKWVSKITQLRDSIEPGLTTLRVMVSFYDVDNPCNVSADLYGEYEDYCIYLDKNYCNTEAMIINTLSIDTTSANLSWSNPYNYQYFKLLLNDPEYPHLFHTVDFIRDTFYTFNNLKECTDYKIIILPYCLPYKTGSSSSYHFKTNCVNAVDNELLQNIILYPNPVNDVLIIEADNKEKMVSIEIFDLFGKRVFSKKYTDSKIIKINPEKILIPGVYILNIENNNLFESFKIIKQ